MIYFDNAATSYPKPPGVVEEVLRVIREKGGNPGRSGHHLSLAASEVVYDTRRAVATFIGAEEEENIIFTQNATYALNLVLQARCTNGCHIIISDMEHNAARRPVLQLVESGIATLSIFSHHGNILENLDRLLKDGDNILVCSHVSNVNGYQFPLEDISRWCLENKVYLIVDASQSLGHIPFQISSIPCDALCAPAHKGLMGIQGCGILYLKSKVPLRQVIAGGSGADSLSPYMPLYLPDRYEAGTLPTPAIASLHASLHFIQEIGLQKIEAHIESLSLFLHKYLGELRGVTLFSHPDSQIIAFRVAGRGSEEIAMCLNEYGICVRGGHHCAPLAHMTLGTTDGGLVRLSPGYFNTISECEIFLDCLDMILKEHK